MKAMNLKPQAQVAAYVERILVLEHYDISMPFSLPLFANGSPTLLFTSARSIIGRAPAAHLTLFGQTVLPETLIMDEGFVLIAYFLKPYALFSIFGITALELTDRPVELSLLTKKGTAELQDRLLNADSVADSIVLLDAYLTGLIAGAKTDSRGITYAADIIAHRPLPEILLHVQNELNVTERTFQRMFEKNIGLAPNLYRRIRQFNSAFQQLNAGNYTKLSDIAFQNGYADQSHYVRAFKEFTGITPKDYVNFSSGG
jgi:AraC-like DNA-binding protein